MVRVFSQKEKPVGERVWLIELNKAIRESLMPGEKVTSTDTQSQLLPTGELLYTVHGVLTEAQLEALFQILVELGW